MTRVSKQIATTFLVCDDVRAESNGKITLVGIYPGEKIVTHLVSGSPQKGGPVAVLNQLALVCFISNGIGKYTPLAEVVSPSGKTIISSRLPEINLVQGNTATLALNGPQFAVPAFGEYHLKLTIGANVFDFRFFIDQGTAANKAGAGAPNVTNSPKSSGSRRGARPKAP